MAEITITKENFEKEILQNDKLVLLDFWATWCGPCKMIAPIISEIAEEYDGQITVGKVNVDEQAELAENYGISSIPTLIIFKNGKVFNTLIGYHEKEEIVNLF